VEIKFTEGILVIEAKRRDHAGLQNVEQLANEWVCAQDEFPGRSIHLLAVGGLADGTRASASTLRKGVANEITRLTGKTASFKFAAVPWGVFTSRILMNLSMLASERHAGLVRLADDLRAASLLHGVPCPGSTSRPRT